MGGDAVMGGSLNFPHKAKATFTYTASSNSEVSEELYSDTAGKLSTGTGRIFDAMTGCPQYQVLVGSTKVDVTTQKMIAPGSETSAGVNSSPFPPMGATPW